MVRLMFGMFFIIFCCILVRLQSICGCPPQADMQNATRDKIDYNYQARRPFDIHTAFRPDLTRCLFSHKAKTDSPRHARNIWHLIDHKSCDATARLPRGRSRERRAAAVAGKWH